MQFHFDYLDFSIAGVHVQRWLFALLIALTVWLAGKLLVRVVSSRVRTLAQRTSGSLDDAIVDALEQTKSWFLLVAGVALATHLLVFPKWLRTPVAGVVTVAAMLQAILYGNQFIKSFVHHTIRRHAEAGSTERATTLSALGFVGRLLVIALVLLAGLQNLGVNVSAVVAGLGIGGIAVALAVQNILGDLIASVSIVLDKPFNVGDFIIVGDLMGTVEAIGLKTTRLRSLSGEQLVFSNADLLSSRIRNYKRMFERRVVFTLGVVYQTSADKLRAIPGYVRTAVERQSKTRFDRTHFSSFGASSLDFEVAYYVLNSDYNVYMDIQQAINLELVDVFSREGIGFAYPTQSIYIENAAQQTGEPTPGRHLSVVT